MKENKNRVLVISHDFYPDNSPNTYRWFNVLRSWTDKNLEIYVVTSHQKNLLRYEEIDGMKIYRVGNRAMDILKERLLSKQVISQEQNKINVHSLKKVSLIKKIYNSTWKKIFFPDFAFLWQSPAFTISKKLIREKDIYNVITVSWPFSAHVVGYRLKNKLNINWIADTIDPFFLSAAVNNQFLFKSLNFCYEKKILFKADSLTLLTEKLKDKYSEIFPLIANKITVNHNVFVPYVYDIDTLKSSLDINVTILVFVGTLSPVTRTPKNILILFKNLLMFNPSLQLHFYGNLEQCDEDFKEYNDLLNRNLFLHGFTPRVEIVSIIQKASAVINIGNLNQYQEPSKLVEFIYLKKKILNICSISDDTSAEMLKSYPLHVNVKISDFYNEKKHKEVFDFLANDSTFVSDDLTNSILGKYMLTSVEKKYFELLKLNDD